MLNRLQNGAVLRIGPFAELNFKTFSDVICHSSSIVNPFKKFILVFISVNQANVLFPHDANEVCEVNVSYEATAFEVIDSYYFECRSCHSIHTRRKNTRARVILIIFLVPIWLLTC